jgi:UDP-3-O-[3-hydroxymyristoyl] glucosamine N-acyltransferase
LGNDSLSIMAVGSLESAVKTPGTLTFLSEKKHVPLLSRLHRSVVLTTADFAQSFSETACVVVSDPKRVFAEIAKNFLPKNPWVGISPQAVVHPQARLGTGVNIGPFAIVCEGAVIGNGTTLYPHSYVGPSVKVGENCEIHPFATLLQSVVLGNRVRIFSGSVLGSEGFGFLEGAEGFAIMPQIGNVVIEDDVRIGAKCTVDRAALGETRIKRGTIIDDQVHIGHNCIVGERNALCAQVGLAGSTVLENNVLLGGQVGLAGHLTVGEGARMAGQSGSSSNLPGGKTYLSSPAVPIEDAIKVFRASRKLPSLVERIRKLEESHGKQ